MLFQEIAVFPLVKLGCNENMADGCPKLLALFKRKKTKTTAHLLVRYWLLTGYW